MNPLEREKRKEVWDCFGCTSWARYCRRQPSWWVKDFTMGEITFFVEWDRFIYSLNARSGMMASEAFIQSHRRNQIAKDRDLFCFIKFQITHDFSVSFIKLLIDSFFKLNKTNPFLSYMGSESLWKIWHAFPTVGGSKGRADRPIGTACMFYFVPLFLLNV